MMPLSLWLLVAGAVALDLAVQAVHVTNQALIVARHTQAQGRMIASYMVFYSLGSAFGALASTYAYSKFGWDGVCATGGGISLAGLLLFLMPCRRRDRA
jgi:predicted MFS family arabinose efflux permease